MLSNLLLLILTLAFIIVFGITNSSNSNNIPQFLSYKYYLALAQADSLNNNDNSNQMQQQQWVDKVNNIKILFSSPVRPVIDSSTQMKFKVQNLTANENIKDLTTRVTIAAHSSGQLRTFKYTRGSIVDQSKKLL